MKPEVMLELLEGAADQLGIKVSYEPLQANFQSGMRGGLCRVKGVDGKHWRVIIDKRATVDERLQTLATAVGGFDTSELELPQKARDLLHLYHRTPPRRSPVRAA